VILQSKNWRTNRLFHSCLSLAVVAVGVELVMVRQSQPLSILTVPVPVVRLLDLTQT
jgi:cytochrome c-type biogenesis protein CcmE